MICSRKTCFWMLISPPFEKRCTVEARSSKASAIQVGRNTARSATSQISGSSSPFSRRKTPRRSSACLRNTNACEPNHGESDLSKCLPSSSTMSLTGIGRHVSPCVVPPTLRWMVSKSSRRTGWQNSKPSFRVTLNTAIVSTFKGATLPTIGQVLLSRGSLFSSRLPVFRTQAVDRNDFASVWSGAGGHASEEVARANFHPRQAYRSGRSRRNTMSSKSSSG